MFAGDLLAPDHSRQHLKRYLGPKGMGNIADVLFKQDLSYDETICVINKSFKIEGRAVNPNVAKVENASAPRRPRVKL